jgi:drug/metabolite transporter (DMT)-like permease
MAPLFAVTFAVVLLGEPLVAGILLGAVLIVAGGILLASEGGRPEHVKTIGLVFALGAASVFASRDTLARWLAVDADVSPELAISATLLAGAATILVAVFVSRRTLASRSWPAFLPDGILFGLYYVSLYVAFFRGRLSVVAPLVATE